MTTTKRGTRKGCIMGYCSNCSKGTRAYCKTMNLGAYDKPVGPKAKGHIAHDGRQEGVSGR